MADFVNPQLADFYNLPFSEQLRLRMLQSGQVPLGTQPAPLAPSFKPAPIAPPPGQTPPSGSGAAGRAAGAAGLALGSAAPFVGAGVAGAGALASLYKVTANDDAQKKNRERLAELERMEQAGQLGLTHVERKIQQAQLYNPMQRAVQQGKASSEQMMASMGNASAGDFAQVRDAQARQSAAAARDVALQVQAANEAKKEQQKAEIDARTQAKAQMKADDLSVLFGDLAKTGAAAGAIAGAPPGTLPNTLLGIGGLRVPGQVTQSGFTDEQWQQILELQRSGRLASILSQVQGGGV